MTGEYGQSANHLISGCAEFQNGVYLASLYHPLQPINREIFTNLKASPFPASSPHRWITDNDGIMMFFHITAQYPHCLCTIADCFVDSWCQVSSSSADSLTGWWMSCYLPARFIFRLSSPSPPFHKLILVAFSFEVYNVSCIIFPSAGWMTPIAPFPDAKCTGRPFIWLLVRLSLLIITNVPFKLLKQLASRSDFNRNTPDRRICVRGQFNNFPYSATCLFSEASPSSEDEMIHRWIDAFKEMGLLKVSFTRLQWIGVANSFYFPDNLEANFIKRIRK